MEMAESFGHTETMTLLGILRESFSAILFNAGGWLFDVDRDSLISHVQRHWS
jgi:uncharacterized membrane protein